MFATTAYASDNITDYEKYATEIGEVGFPAYKVGLDKDDNELTYRYRRVLIKDSSELLPLIQKISADEFLTDTERKSFMKVFYQAMRFLEYYKVVPEDKFDKTTYQKNYDECMPAIYIASKGNEYLKNVQEMS